MNGQDILIGLSHIDRKFIEESEQDICKPRHKKVLRKPVLLAAMIALMLFLMGCYVLSEADWFKSFFSERMEQDLSENQAAFIEENTKKLGQSVTVDGYTLTVASAIADARNAYIKLILEGPPGTALDADIYWFEPRKTTEGDGFEDSFFKLGGPEEGYGAGTWQGVDDGDATDNSYTILWTLDQTINPELPSFEEGVTYRIHITDLEGYYGAENRSVLLAENGVWDFDIVFDSINDSSVELITEPVSAAFNDVSVEVTSFTLQTMSAQAHFACKDGERGILCFIDSVVVLKDGTRVEFRPSTFNPTGDASFLLSSPIVLDEVDYVELRDGTQIPMP